MVDTSDEHDDAKPHAADDGQEVATADGLSEELEGVAMEAFQSTVLELDNSENNAADDASRPEDVTSSSIARRTRSSKQQRCNNNTSKVTIASSDDTAALATLTSTVFSVNGEEVAVDDMPAMPNNFSIPLLPPIDTKSITTDGASSTLSTDRMEQPTAHDNRDNNGSKDVIYAKGAAAQTITNPGNLYFYQLCNERYEEFAALHSTDPRRRTIGGEIVDAVHRYGGKFRTRTGGEMTRAAAIDKARDRMRGIGMPKIRPVGFGPHDVVCGARGAAIHLYPGNAKWHDLLDGYVIAYFCDVLFDKNTAGAGNNSPTTTQQPRAKNGRFGKGKQGKRGFNIRPPHRDAIVEETIRIIHKRGGKFLDERLNELSNKEVAIKTHVRFRELKKHLIAGTRVFTPHDDERNSVPVDNNGGGASKEEGSIISDKVSVGTEIFRKRLGGFTETKTVVSSEQELQALRRKKRSRARMLTVKKKKVGQKKNANNGLDDNLENDDASFDSSMLESDDDCISSDNSEDEDKEEQEMNAELDHHDVKKQQQAEDRAKRLERRRSGISAATQKKKKMEDEHHQAGEETKQSSPRKRARSSCKCNRAASPEPEPDSEPEPEHTLSEYELKRLEKIKRNQERLKSLGLI